MGLWFLFGIACGWMLKGIAEPERHQFSLERPFDGEALLRQVKRVVITQNGQEVDTLQIEGTLTPAAAAALADAWYRAHVGPSPKGMV